MAKRTRKSNGQFAGTAAEHTAVLRTNAKQMKHYLNRVRQGISGKGPLGCKGAARYLVLAAEEFGRLGVHLGHSGKGRSRRGSARALDSAWERFAKKCVR